jgi:hypothetical protein
MEGSVVSIPSNVEGIITAYSRQKLHHPLVKQFAQRAKDGLPLMLKGGWTAKAPDEPCDGKRCVKHACRRFKRRLARGTYPRKKQLRSLAKTVRSAIENKEAKQVLNLLGHKAGQPSQGPQPCLCPAYRPGDKIGNNRLAKRVASAVSQGLVGIRGLRALERRLKQANSATRKKQPTPATPIERGSRDFKVTAFHEAGHAVVGSLLGLPISEVAVGNLVGMKGLVSYKSTDHPTIETGEMLLIRTAGFAAERWLGETNPDYAEQPDTKGAQKLIGKLTGRKPGDTVMPRLVERASKLFLNPVLAKATEALAAELIGSVGGRVDGEKFGRIIAETVGDKQQEALAQIKDHAVALTQWARTFA